MSLHGVGESFVEMFFRKILDRFGIHYLPPNTLKGVDYLLTNGKFMFVELEDTVAEVYIAATQMQRIFGIAQLYNAYAIIAVPLPRNLSSIRGPLAYFFRITKDYDIKRELWLLSDERIFKIHEENVEPSPILSQISTCIPVKTENRVLNPKLTRELIRTLRKVISQ